MTTTQSPTLAGLRLTLVSGETYLLTILGDDSVDAATSTLYSSLILNTPELITLCRRAAHGSATGREGQVRTPSVTSVKFRLSSLIGSRIPLSSQDTGGHPVSAAQDWSA